MRYFTRSDQHEHSAEDVRGFLIDANDKFAAAISKAHGAGRAPSGPPPTFIPSRHQEWSLPSIDNGPDRPRTVTPVTRLPRSTAEQQRALTETVALVERQAALDRAYMPRRGPQIGRFTLADLGTNNCRWPVTEDSPFLFCGSAIAGQSYCAVHEAEKRRGGRQ